jgi:hypothetical protein
VTQQNNQQAKSNRKVSDPQPPLDAVIGLRFGESGWSVIGLVAAMTQ